jgi:hypothetical protein
MGQSALSACAGRGLRLAIARPTDAPAQLDTPTLLAEWTATLLDAGAGPDAPLFPALNRHGDIVNRRGCAGGWVAIEAQNFSDRLRELARSATCFGDDDTRRYDNVSGHSLRRGLKPLPSSLATTRSPSPNRPDIATLR